MERTTSRAIREQTVQTERTVEEGQTVEETKIAKEPDTAKEEQTEVFKEAKVCTFFKSKLKHAAMRLEIYYPEIAAGAPQEWEINGYVRKF